MTIYINMNDGDSDAMDNRPPPPPGAARARRTPPSDPPRHQGEMDHDHSIL